MKKIFLLISFTALLQVNAQEDVEITNYVENNSYRGVKTEYEKRESANHVSIYWQSFDSLGIITKKGWSSYKKYDYKNYRLHVGDFKTYLRFDWGASKKGDMESSTLFYFIDNKLNGLYFTGSLDNGFYDRNSFNYKKRYYAIINNNIVGSSWRTSNGRLIRDEYSNHELELYFNFKQWAETGIIPQFDFSNPLYHKLKWVSPNIVEDELYYDLESMINIFLDDFISHLKELTYNVLDEIARRKKSPFSPFNNFDLGFFDDIEELTLSAQNQNIYSVFEELEDEEIAKAFGIDDDKNIILKIDPSKWSNASVVDKWYILYHELGHDVLNLRHGQGGRMMFNYPTKKHTWEDFFNDRQHMYAYIIKRIFPEFDEDLLFFTRY